MPIGVIIGRGHPIRSIRGSPVLRSSMSLQTLVTPRFSYARIYNMESMKDLISLRLQGCQLFRMIQICTLLATAQVRGKGTGPGEELGVEIQRAGATQHQRARTAAGGLVVGKHRPAHFGGPQRFCPETGRNCGYSDTENQRGSVAKARHRGRSLSVG